MATSKLLLAALLLTPAFGLVLPGEANNGLILDERAVAFVCYITLGQTQMS